MMESGTAEEKAGLQIQQMPVAGFTDGSSVMWPAMDDGTATSGFTMVHIIPAFDGAVPEGWIPQIIEGARPPMMGRAVPHPGMQVVMPAPVPGGNSMQAPIA